MSSVPSSSSVVEFTQDAPKSLKGVGFIVVIIFPVMVSAISALLAVSLLPSLAASGLLLACTVTGLMRMTVSRESLLVMRMMGLQLKTEYWLGGEQTTFISHQQIEDVIINEAITMHRVVYYLAVLLKSEDNTPKLIPLFQNSLPPLETLKEIQQGCQDVLWNNNR